MRAVATCLILLSVGCSSHPRFYGGGYNPSFWIPKVEMSVLEVVDQVDEPPIMKGPQVTVPYPFEMKRAGIAGEVLARALVEADGSLSSVSIERASQPEFGAPVMYGLPKCAFFPAKRAGLPVRAMIRCKIKFSLDEE